MENITLSDPPRVFDGQQHITSELSDLTKASFTNSVGNPFKSLFPAMNNSTQPSSNGSPLLFQQKTNAIPTLNPLLQLPSSTSQLPALFIQPTIPPPSFPNLFTPLNTNTNNQQSSIQSQLIIGNQQIPSQAVRFPHPNFSTNIETINGQSPVIRPPPLVSSQDVPHNYQQSQSVPPLPPPPPQQTSSSSTTTTANPYSARASLSERIYPSMPTSQISSVPFQQQTIQPLPPSNHFVPTMSPTNTYPGPETNTHNPTYQPPNNYNPTSPWSNDLSTTYDQQQNDQSSANSSGIWGWLNNNKMLATVVEKAKTGIETVMTTVDPQMKQYIPQGHEIHIVVTSTKETKLTPLRDAFTHVFGRATAQGIDVQTNVALQPVGFEAGFQAAQQRIENLRRQNLIHSDQCIISIENFLAELIPDMYFDLNYIYLSDPLNSIELHLFTQAIPVPIEYVYQARDRTSISYPFKSTGYMVTIGEAIHSQLPFINPEDWQEIMSGTSIRDTIYATCKTLAYMYKQRLNRRQ